MGGWRRVGKGGRWMVWMVVDADGGEKTRMQGTHRGTSRTSSCRGTFCPSTPPPPPSDASLISPSPPSAPVEGVG